jgi:hypothetical protein
LLTSILAEDARIYLAATAIINMATNNSAIRYRASSILVLSAEVGSIVVYQVFIDKIIRSGSSDALYCQTRGR